MNAVHFSSASCEWGTPPELFAELDRQHHFTLDPCATPENAKCVRYFTQADNGLEQDWGTESVFMNPPYGRTIGKWMRKAFLSAQAGATVVCLVPSRTDTAWWHDYAMKGETRLLRGRLKFELFISQALRQEVKSMAFTMQIPAIVKETGLPKVGVLAILNDDPRPLAPAPFPSAIVTLPAGGRRATEPFAAQPEGIL